MQSVRRSSWLKELSIYFAALVTVIGSLYFGIQHVGGAVQEHMRAPVERETTKLDQMVNSAREIREAIANAEHAIEPLQPITAKPARQLSASLVHSREQRKLPEIRLNKEARKAFAAAAYNGHPPPATPSIDSPRNIIVPDFRVSAALGTPAASVLPVDGELNTAAPYRELSPSQTVTGHVAEFEYGLDGRARCPASRRCG